MKIWVDADACPNVIKDILFRAAMRVEVPLILVANQPLRIPASPWIKATTVESGFDVADKFIADQTQLGDLIITADIPLAYDVLEKGGHALNPRGELYTSDTIKQKLTMRDLMDQLRGSGISSNGPAPLQQRDLQAFARQLDKLLAKVKR